MNRTWMSLDRLGIFMSMICVVHCVALPLILGVLPAACCGGHESRSVHFGLMIVVALTAALAFGRGIFRHGSRLVVALGSLGITLLVVGLLIGHEWERVVTVSGGCCLALAHLLNHRLCQTCSRQ